MLPFLKPRHRDAGLSIEIRKPDNEKDNEIKPLEHCAQDLIDAIHAQDRKAVARAFKDLFSIVEMEPHEEYDHDEDEQESE